jgi:hypothetical protein
MIRVQFHRTDEFLREARDFAQGVDVGQLVCRVTFKHVTNLNTGMTEIFLCACYQDDQSMICLDDSLCSDLTARLAEEGPPATSTELRKRLIGSLTELGFEIRGGIVVF